MLDRVGGCFQTAFSVLSALFGDVGRIDGYVGILRAVA